MNERIKELVAQSGIFPKDDLSKFGLHEYMNGYHAQGFMLEKFARLILEDCVTICEEGSKTQTTSGGVAILIKQRFGL